MQERIRKAKEEQYLLKERSKGNLIANLEKNRETNVSMLNMISTGEVNIENNNTIDSRIMSDSFSVEKSTTFAYIEFKSNDEGFKTTKGMSFNEFRNYATKLRAKRDSR